ncbi:MAG: ADP-ribosylglycohydrolase family protein [Anaerolineae bacterium]|nr:ADP-ribosylglycohydrolase family protein [Anaerolineae bacterium]
MDEQIRDRILGCAVGAAVGDALGMPLEFGPARSANALVRDMQSGRIPAGRFTDDTEMALALAESLLAHRPLDADDLAWRFMAWQQANPPDIGIHTRNVLSRIASGTSWRDAVQAVQGQNPDSAGNGSLMRCWPVAVACRHDLGRLLADSRLQSEVTHPHAECVAACAWANAAIYHLFHGCSRGEALAAALDDAAAPESLRRVVDEAPRLPRSLLASSGWVRHTLQSAVWGLTTTHSFEEAVVQVVNLGNDADTAGAVVGALAGAAYGFAAIPARWVQALRGEWPLGSGTVWRVDDLCALALRLARIDA